MTARTKAVRPPVPVRLVITRILDAPRSLVFRAWTEPQHLVHWSCPHGFTLTHCEGVLEPGGSWRSCMRSPEGNDLWLGGVYREIVAPERLVFTHAWEDASGRRGQETTVTVAFTDERGKTKMVFRQEGFASAEDRDGHSGGWNECFERLAAFLKTGTTRNADHGKIFADVGALETMTVRPTSQGQPMPAAPDDTASREITATRVVAAPRALVFRVWTEPEHIAQWWGPDGFTTTIYEMDVRPGGVWRFVMHGPDGRDYQNRIVYVEVTPPERLVYDHVSGPKFHATVTFADVGGKTAVTVRMLFDTAAERDATAKQFGAVEGLQQTLGRLAGYVIKS